MAGVTAVFGGAGLIGGVVYWLIAGITGANFSGAPFPYIGTMLLAVADEAIE